MTNAYFSNRSFKIPIQSSEDRRLSHCLLDVNVHGHISIWRPLVPFMNSAYSPAFVNCLESGQIARNRASIEHEWTIKRWSRFTFRVQFGRERVQWFCWCDSDSIERVPCIRAPLLFLFSYLLNGGNSEIVKLRCISCLLCALSKCSVFSSFCANIILLLNFLRFSSNEILSQILISS